MSIELLGHFAVSIGGVPVDDSAWPGRRPVELVQLLALSESRELLRDQVIEALWPHLDVEAAGANLRKAAHHARQVLESSDAVVLRGGTVALYPERSVSVDADEFELRAAAADGAADCARVADTWGGELLPNALYEEWTQARRARLRRVRLDLLRRAGRWAELVSLDPTDETAYQELMHEALASGSRSGALRWYGQLRTILARELGVRPSDVTERLLAECRAGLAPTSTSLVGREAEIATAEAALAADSHGRYGALAIRGAAGLGKTALMRHLEQEALSRGWFTGVVRAEEGGAAYRPLIACIEEVALERPEALDGLPSSARAVLGALTSATRPSDPPDGPLSRHQVIGAFQQLLAAAASGSPVLIVIDDAHLADDATLDALSHLASTVRDVLLVLTHRDAPTNAALVACLQRIDRAGRLRRVDLGPLAPDAMRALVLEASARDIDDSIVDAIVERAEGNPFVACELARAGSTEISTSGLSAIITARLVDVEPNTMAVLQRVAVASEDLDSSTLVALTGDTEEAALSVLDHALDTGVLVVDGTRYRFRHDLVRQALIDQVPPHQRAAVHRDVARRLGQAGAAAATVAHHWLAAGEPGEATEWSLRAARDALELGAFADALRHARRVLDHDARDPEARRVEAEALDNMGEPASLTAYDAAIEAADEADRADLVAMRALAQLKLGDVPGALDAIRGATPTSVAGRLSEALTYAGAAALGFADPALGTAKAAECRRLALQSGDSAAIVVASWAQAAAAHARGELRDSVLEDLRDTKDLPHLAVRVFDGQLCITQRFLYGSRPYPDVIAFADALADEGARLGAARGHAFGVTLRGEAELLSGRLDDAETDLVEGGRLHRSIGGATGEALALQRLAELAARRGDRDRAQDLLADALDLARVTDIGFHLLDRIYGTRIELADDPDEAVALVAEAADAVRGPLETCPGCRITFAVPAAIAHAKAGDIESARELETACEFLAHVVMKLPAWDAAYDEVRAHLAQAEGDAIRSRELFDQAARGFLAAGHPWDHERCRALAVAS